MKVEKIKQFGENCVHYGAYDKEAGKSVELARHVLQEGELCTVREGDESDTASDVQQARHVAVKSGHHKDVPQQLTQDRQIARAVSLKCACALLSQTTPFAQAAIDYAEKFEKWLTR